MYIERTLEPTIRKISETFPVLIVTGPRQVGKATVKYAENILYRFRLTFQN